MTCDEVCEAQKVCETSTHRLEPASFLDPDCQPLSPPKELNGMQCLKVQTAHCVGGPGGLKGCGAPDVRERRGILPLAVSVRPGLAAFHPAT